jgi:hypothetical protein
VIYEQYLVIKNFCRKFAAVDYFEPMSKTRKRLKKKLKIAPGVWTSERRPSKRAVIVPTKRGRIYVT